MIQELLEEKGFNNVSIVKEQEQPDPEFPTVDCPNPKDEETFRLAEIAGKATKADILMATDPDADRPAIKARNDYGEYEYLSGNQIGALLTYYILTQARIPSNPVIVKSIVTDNMGKAIANKYDVEVIDALVGFKNIYGFVNEWDITKERNYIFGYEESIGFGIGTFTRDKDAVSAAIVIAEMAAFYKSINKSLLDILTELYETFGYYGEELISKSFEGKEGQLIIDELMKDFRENPVKNIDDLKFISKTDYQIDNTGLPETNTLKFEYKGGHWFAIRPSGTEPKLKIYIHSVGNNEDSRDEIIENIYETIDKRIKTVVKRMG